MIKNYFLLIILFLFFFSANAQYTNRIETEFSLKESNLSDEKKLSMGKVYFDKGIRQLIFRVSFPEREVVCVTDSVIYRFRNDSLVSKSPAFGMLEFSIFNLFLNGDLAYYGLKQSPFELSEVENDGKMVISTWMPPEDYLGKVGKMMLSQIDKKIFGLISFGPENEVISKQFFEDYQDVKGYGFPTKVIQYLYAEKGEEVKMSTYKNVRLNNYEDEELYHYTIPVY